MIWGAAFDDPHFSCSLFPPPVVSDPFPFAPGTSAHSGYQLLVTETNFALSLLISSNGDELTKEHHVRLKKSFFFPSRIDARPFPNANTIFTSGLVNPTAAERHTVALGASAATSAYANAFTGAHFGWNGCG